MKNITVLTVLVIIIGAITTNNSAYCQDTEKERNYCFSFGMQYGFVHGQALEFVYPVRGDTKGELLSELKWDMKPVFYYGAQIDFNRRNLMSGPGFFSSVSFKAGVPGDSGIMEDRDWLSKENGNLTHFSSHTNETTEFFWLDAAFGASFPVKSYLYIIPYLNGSWMHFGFTARDAKIKYARIKTENPVTYYPIDDNPTEKSYKGDDIKYIQDWLFIAVGFSIGTKILSPFSFDLSFQISPFTYCAAKDEHLAREDTFMDYTGWGLFLEPRGSFSFSLEQIDFSLEFTYRYIGRTRGESYTKHSGGNLSPSGEAGAGLSLTDTRFIVRVRI